MKKLKNKYCKKCGSKLSEDFVCDNCGGYAEIEDSKNKERAKK